jgi:hypothetical protein
MSSSLGMLALGPLALRITRRRSTRIPASCYRHQPGRRTATPPTALDSWPHKVTLESKSSTPMAVSCRHCLTGDGRPSLTIAGICLSVIPRQAAASTRFGAIPTWAMTLGPRGAALSGQWQAEGTGDRFGYGLCRIGRGVVFQRLHLFRSGRRRGAVWRR